MLHTIIFSAPTGSTARAIPADTSIPFSHYADYGIAATESVSQLGTFTITLDDTEYTKWWVFLGASNPTTSDNNHVVIDLAQGALTEQYDTATMIDSFNRFAVTGSGVTPDVYTADIGIAVSGSGNTRLWAWTVATKDCVLFRSDVPDGTDRWVIEWDGLTFFLGPTVASPLGTYTKQGTASTVTLAKKQIASKDWRFKQSTSTISPPSNPWMPSWGGLAGHEVLTLQDMVHSMTLRTGGTPSERHNARIVKAIQSAIRSLHTKHGWNYYKAQTRFTTSAERSMTIEYDRTGGASERLVTITDGDNWPADAAMGEILIGGNFYKVHRRLSNTTATLEPDSAMMSDYEGDATWRRRAYTFGREVLKIEYAHNITNNRPLTSIPFAEFNASTFSSTINGHSRCFSWQNHGGKFGGCEFILHPAPTEEETIEVSASVLPITPSIHSVTGSNLAGSANSDTVTSAGAAFHKRLVGCIIRVSSNSTTPTDLDSDNWDFQSFIIAAPTATTLTLSEALPETISARGYAISSPIDIEASVMLEALEDEAFYQYTKNHDHAKSVIASEMAKKSLREAMSRDRRVGDHAMDAGSPSWQIYKSDATNLPTED